MASPRLSHISRWGLDLCLVSKACKKKSKNSHSSSIPQVPYIVKCLHIYFHRVVQVHGRAKWGRVLRGISADALGGRYCSVMFCIVLWGRNIM